MVKMNILHIHEVYHPYKGGSAIRIQSLLDEQVENNLLPNDNMYVLCTYKGVEDVKSLPSKESINGVNVIRIHNIKYIGLYALYLSFSLKIDHIHVHNSRIFWLIYPFMFFRKIILEIHSLRNLNGYKNKLQDLSLRLSNKLIVLSETTRNYLIKNGLNETKIIVVRNGVDYNLLNLRNIKVIGHVTTDGIKKLVYSGSFYEWQGIITILELARKIKTNNDKIQITLIGEGPLKNEVENFIKNNSLHEVLFLHDYLPANKLHKLLKQFDLFLFLRPKRRETELTFPLKILEVGAIGLPIIMTKREAHLEIFNNDDPNLYCTLVGDDIEEIYSKILSELQNVSELCEKSTRFKDLIFKNNYSWQKSALILHSVYEKK